MGLLGDIFKGIGGAATGFLTGGPAGAVIGGIGSLASSGNSTTRTGSSTGSRQVQLRPWEQGERNLLDQSYQQLLNGAMTPEAAANLEENIYQNIFNPASRQLADQYNTLNAQNYAQAARRGAGNTSRTVEQDRASAQSQAADTANLEANARIQAMMARMQEEETRRANMRAALERINSMWSNRLQSSGITTSGSESVRITEPDTTTSTIFQGLGSAAANGQFDGVNNWISGLFGGGSNPNPLDGVVMGPLGGMITKGK